MGQDDHRSVCCEKTTLAEQHGGKSWGQQGFISIRESISFFEELVYVGLLVLEELVFTNHHVFFFCLGVDSSGDSPRLINQGGPTDQPILVLPTRVSCVGVNP